MLLRCSQSAYFGKRNLDSMARFVYLEVKAESKTAEIDPKNKDQKDESLAKSKDLARKDVDAIFDLEYNTYDFRKLPQELRKLIFDDFDQWIDGNIYKYDQDKNSGIDAKEYENFKVDLTAKVTKILDRLVQAKKEKIEEAKEAQESAQEISERQKRLEGVANVDQIVEKNLDNSEGLSLEILKLQEGLKKDTTAFSELGGQFSKAKEKVEEANKSKINGLAALGEWVAQWVNDSSEVVAAKQELAKSIADFKQKLAQMKERMKERQERGRKLNSAPEEMKKHVAKKYQDQREFFARHRTELAESLAKNEERRLSALESKKTLVDQQKKHEDQQKNLENKREMLRERAQDAKNHAFALNQIISTAKENLAKAQSTKNAKEEKVFSLQLQKALERKPETDQNAVSFSTAETDINVQVIKSKENIAKSGSSLNEIDNVVATTESSRIELNNQDLEIDQLVVKNDANEEIELAKIDTIDSAISESVLEVDTANFELVRGGEDYLKMLESMAVRGPGTIDALVALVKPITNTVFEVWANSKEMPYIGPVVEVLGYMVEGAEDSVTWAWNHTISWGIDRLGDGFTWVGDKLYIPDLVDWMREATKHMSIGHPTGNAAMDAILDTMTLGGFAVFLEMDSKILSKFKELFASFGMIISHPVEAGKGLLQLVNHPGIIIESLLQKEEWGKASPAVIISGLVMEIIMTLTGGGAAVKGYQAIAANIAKNAGRVSARVIAESLLLGGKVAGVTFGKDMGHLALGILKLPVTLTNGAMNLINFIARGGKLVLGKGKALLRGSKEGEVLDTLGAEDIIHDEHVLETLGREDIIHDEHAVGTLGREDIIHDDLDTLGADDIIHENANMSASEKALESDLGHVAQDGDDVVQAKQDAQSYVEPGAENTAVYSDKAKRTIGHEITRVHEDHSEVTQLYADNFDPRKATANSQEVTSVYSETENKLAHDRREPVNQSVASTSEDTPIMVKVKDPNETRVYSDAQYNAAHDPEMTKFHSSEVYPRVESNGYNAMVTNSMEELESTPVMTNLEETDRALALYHLENQLSQFPKLEGKLYQVLINKGINLKDLTQRLDAHEIALITNAGPEISETLLAKIIQRDFDYVEDVVDGVKVNTRFYLSDTPLGRGGAGNVSKGFYVQWRVGEKFMPGDKLISGAIKLENELPSQVSAAGRTTTGALFDAEVNTSRAVRDLPNRTGIIEPTHAGKRIIRGANGEILREEAVIITKEIEPLPGTAGVRLSDVSPHLPVENTIRLTSEAFEGVGQLHNEVVINGEVGVLHLDVKPDNIFVGTVEGSTRAHGMIGDLSSIPMSELGHMRIGRTEALVTVDGVTTTKEVSAVQRELSNGNHVLVPTTPSYMARTTKHMECLLEWTRQHPGEVIQPNMKALPESFARTIEVGFGDQLHQTLGSFPAEVSAPIKARYDNLIKRLDDVPDLNNLPKGVTKAQALDKLRKSRISIPEMTAEMNKIADEVSAARQGVSRAEPLASISPLN